MTREQQQRLVDSIKDTKEKPKEYSDLRTTNIIPKARLLDCDFPTNKTSENIVPDAFTTTGLDCHIISEMINRLFYHSDNKILLQDQKQFMFK